MSQESQESNGRKLPGLLKQYKLLCPSDGLEDAIVIHFGSLERCKEVRGRLMRDFKASGKFLPKLYIRKIP